jgi:DNA-binding CsgD family transcriptional regulator
VGAWLTDEGAAELLQALLDGAFETPLWSTFLERLRIVVEADYVTLGFRSPGRHVEETIDLVAGAASPADMQETYRKFFRHGAPPGRTPIEGYAYTLEELLGPGRRGPNEDFYRELVDMHGIVGIRQIRVREPTGIDGWLTIIRRGRDFGSDEAALLSALAAPLRSVLRHYVAQERERFAGSVTAEAVRRLQFGWITLDREGQVLDCDDQGALVLAKSGVLSCGAAGRLAARPVELEREIQEAISSLSAHPGSRPRAITLARDPWLDMLLLPPRRTTISSKAAPAVVAYVHGDSWRGAERCEQLAELFGLLPREARLSLALCRGMTIAEAAAQHGLTVESARTYTKTIYQKIGARGLPDLVRIVMRSVLAVAPDL